MVARLMKRCDYIFSPPRCILIIDGHNTHVVFVLRQAKNGNLRCCVPIFGLRRNHTWLSSKCCGQNSRLRRPSRCPRWTSCILGILVMRESRDGYLVRTLFVSTPSLVADAHRVALTISVLRGHARLELIHGHFSRPPLPPRPHLYAETKVDQGNVASGPATYWRVLCKFMVDAKAWLPS